jgi:transcriptional regulator with XRE-family HTH domain
MTNTKSRTVGRPKKPAPAKTDAVLRVRQSLDMTQAELAGALGCSVPAVSKMEQDERLPGSLALRTALTKLAKRAGVSLEAKAEEVTP